METTFINCSSDEQDSGGDDPVAQPEAGQVEDRESPERRPQAWRRRDPDREQETRVETRGQDGSLQQLLQARRRREKGTCTNNKKCLSIFVTSKRNQRLAAQLWFTGEREEN